MKITRKQIGAGVAIVIFLYLFLHYFGTILSGVAFLVAAASSLIIGAIVAYALNIVMSFYEKKFLDKCQISIVRKGKRIISILMSLATIALILFLLVRLVVPELQNCVVLLIDAIPGLLDQAQQLVAQNETIADLMPDEFMRQGSQNIDLDAIVAKVTQWATSGAGLTIVGYVTGVFSSVLNFIMGFIFALYILASKETLKSQFLRLMDHYMKPAVKDKTLYVLDTLNDSFHSFIVGQCMEAVIIGVLCIVGMVIFRFPYAVMIGALVGSTALIPIAGAYIGAAVGAIMILTVSPTKALLFLVFIVVLQQLEGQLIYPKVVGTSIGLPGIWVFAAVVLGGALFGIPGILLGIPLLSAAYHMLQDDMHRREENPNLTDKDRKKDVNASQKKEKS